MLQRKRKTKDPCPECFLHKDRCICAIIPILDIKTKVSLVIHAKEVKRTTNTGRLALKILKNSEMRIRGQDQDPVDLSDLLQEQYQALLFYPAGDAVELTAEFSNQFNKPIHLIVPDGNWRQASKVAIRHKELSHLPRVMIAKPNLATQHLRVEKTEAGMSTLQAIAEALKVIEGDKIYESMMTVYRAKLEQTLIGRGRLSRGQLIRG